MNRRDFVQTAAGVVAAGSLGAPAALAAGKILNYNSNMEYRRLGKTNLMVSAICLGGHWKRAKVMLGTGFSGAGYDQQDFQNVNDPAFLRNRTEVVEACMAAGINYIDACAGPEVLAYSKVLKGRRDHMYLGYSWHTRESRYSDWRDGKKMLEGLNQGLKEAQLDYVDLWRISLPMDRITDLGELLMVEQSCVEALTLAKKQGKARFTGVSTHNRVWLRSIVEQYPAEVETVLFPYTADSKVLPDDSVFDAVKKHDTGVFGIKPFADNSLFKGDSAPTSPYAEEDDRRARLALRYILSNPAITAPIPGMVNAHQVQNAAKAVLERRKLDHSERTELKQATEAMWANLRPNHRWLRDWEYV
jgi:predicted aldo/keto reductase-like oxidoreductase